MSRRKQSKPRAVLKCGEDDEEITKVEKENNMASDHGMDIIEEEEIDDKNASDDNEDNIEEQQNNENKENDKDNRKSNELDDSKIDSFPFVKIKEENSKQFENEKNQDDDEQENKIEIDSEKEQNDDENLDELMSSQDDLNSSDSFYSDYYSTHTSLSYSPSSMSEEANSLNSAPHAQNVFSVNSKCGDDEYQNISENKSDVNIKNGISFDDKKFDEQSAEKFRDKRLRVSTKEQSSTKLRKLDKNSNEPTGQFKNGYDPSKNGLESSYQCQFCDKAFPRLGYLKKHEQSHAEHLPFKCDYCARLFKHKRSRDRHTKLHTGDRRYKCPHCEAAFSRSDHLKIHMKTHDNQKPFQCNVCNRGYNTAAALTSHMQNHKKQKSLVGKNNYESSSSDTLTVNKGIQQRNKYKCVPQIVVATGIEPDSTRSPMNRNNFRHVFNPNENKVNSLLCIYCTKSDFSTVEQLNKHVQQIHHNAVNNPYPREIFKIPQPNSNVALNCDFCALQFSSIPSMMHHIQSAHKDKLLNRPAYSAEFESSSDFDKQHNRVLTPRSHDEYLKLNKFKDNQDTDKLDQRSASLPSAADQKTDEQSIPTDLSQPRKRSQSPFDNSNSESKNNSGMFLCNQCNAALPDFNTFCSHLKSHLNSYGINLMCPQCGLALHDSREIERHYLSHFVATTLTYTCAMSCKKIFKNSDELQTHLFEAHSQLMYKCSICSDLFSSKNAIQVHFSTSHQVEKKIYQCSSCKEIYEHEKELVTHVKTRHQIQSGTIQCMFCRVVCKSELEMHFHLAQHSRQFKCPTCPETFHVEFLLDRHIKTHHLTKPQSETINPNVAKEINGIYYKMDCRTPPGNLENHLSTSTTIPEISYNPKVNAVSKKYSFLYDMSQAYFDSNKSLPVNRMYDYNNDQIPYHGEHNSYRNLFVRPPEYFTQTSYKELNKHPFEDKSKSNLNESLVGFSCGICDRNDFKNEVEVHSHRKIVHNFKTGVSLRCAYCNEVFKSRNELENHMKTCHNSTGKHKCLICDEIFPSPAILAEHKLQHSKVGQSGVCSYCLLPLNDFCAFKTHMSEHNVEGQIPTECICCRQTLHSDFEIGLHAKFHTKSSINMDGNECALCLISLPSTSEARICEKCVKKHNLANKFNKACFDKINTFQKDNNCNICKTVFSTPQRLREHLVEHSFFGCEDRGFICYICSAVFVTPSLLLAHMNKHGPESKPYDCNICFEKFYFRAELDNHRIEHENKKEEKRDFLIELNDMKSEENETKSSDSITISSFDKSKTSNLNINANETTIINNNEVVMKSDIKTEKSEENEDNDDEYIEVEKVMENKINEKYDANEIS